jgi:hypothetical protein
MPIAARNLLPGFQSPPVFMCSSACVKAVALTNSLLLSVVHAGPGAAIGEPVPEVKVTAVPEPSPIFLLAGALAVLLLLMRKGGPR